MPYPKKIMDQAFEELGRRRNKARSLHQYRQQEIQEKLPRVAQIDRELINTNVSIARVILSGENVEEKIERLRQTNLYMQQAKARELTQAGYPADYLEMQYSCPVCKDTGYTEGGMCSCMKTLLKEIAYRQLSESANLTDCKFQTFRLDYYPTTALPGYSVSAREIMTQAYNRCVQYANSFTKNSPSLFFQGATGLGKTHLSLSIASVVIERGYDVLYTPVQSLMNRLEKERFSRDYGADEDSMQFVLDSDLLILDDLGAEFITNFSVSALYNILNSRLIERKPTIISTNLDIKRIEEKYSQRIVSRLVGGCTTIPFVGNDIRTMRR